MNQLSLHPRKPIAASIGHGNNYQWINLVIGDLNIIIHGGSTDPARDIAPGRPTLSEIAEALARPMIELDCDKQAADHDREEAARLAAGGSPIEYDLSDVFGLDTPAQDVSNGLPIQNDATTA